MTRLSKFEEYFKEQSIRLDQAHLDGKTIVSSHYLARFSRVLSKLVKELDK